MRFKAVIYKVSVNSENVFSLRKNPEEIIEAVYKKFNEKNNNLYKKVKTIYAIQKIENIKFHGEEMILSRLIKYVDEKEREQWDDKNYEIINVIEENDILEKAYFIYDKKREYIFLEERSGLNIEDFKKAVEFIINFNDLELSVTLNALKDERVKEKILSLKTIIRAHFEVIPNNPGRRMWNIFEEIGEELNSTSSVYDFENKKGLKYEGKMEDLVDDVNEGHGRQYVISGYNHSEEYDEIRSHDHIKRYHQKVEASELGRINGLWAIVKEVLNI